MTAELDSGQIDAQAGKWRAREDALLERHSTELNRLREKREKKEIHLSTELLKYVHYMGRTGLNERFKLLQNLVTELPRDDESLIAKTGPEVSLVYYSDVAEHISDSGARMFIKDLVNSFKHSYNRSDNIKIAQVDVFGSDTSNNFLGHLVLCNGYGQFSNHFSLDFNVYNDENMKPPKIEINKNVSTRTSLLEEKFGHLLLVEKAIVAGALFSATDIAITEKLKEFQKS